MPGPALGLLELASIARGMVAADAMAKRAQVTLVRAAPTTPGKFVVIVAGGEEEVAQALEAGLEAAGEGVLDRLYLPKADPQLALALAGALDPDPGEGALGILETFSVASTLLAADRAVKTAGVVLRQLRLARGLGGRAFFVLSGELPEVEAAIEAGRAIIHDGMLLTSEIIPRPHPDLRRALLAPA
jgi:microcompartment protein CcmL/EutN